MQVGKPCQYAGELIERIKTSVLQHGVTPHTPIVVRVGDLGLEMLIEHVKVQGGVNGPKIVLQVMSRE